MDTDPKDHYDPGLTSRVSRGWQDYWPGNRDAPKNRTTRFIPCINWLNEHEFDFLKPKKKKPRHSKKKKDSPTKQPPYEPYSPPAKPYPYEPQERGPWDPKDPWGKKPYPTPYPDNYPQWRDKDTEK
tara:strand:- start:490 stop:870 length:381 start_codon:yes stop_codon:yes gene_type:complete